MRAVVEIRSYTLKECVEFTRAMRDHALPLLKAAGVDVVSFRRLALRQS